MKGRKPIPLRIKQLTGNPGKRKLPDEPQFADGAGPAPKHLSKEAKAEWRAMAPALEAAGLLKCVDRAALAAYCQAYGRWVQAERRINEDNMAVKAPSGYPMQNPWLSIANKSMEQMKAFLVEFGMTPSSRARVAPVAQPAADDFDTFAHEDKTKTG